MWLPLDHPVLDAIFLLSVAVIWAMILYQMVLTFAGYRYRRRVLAAHARRRQANADLTGVSVLIPARNEALVIERTIRTILSLDYPAELLQLVIINDGSTDDTAALVAALAQKDARIRLVDVPRAESGHGKAFALNLGLQHCDHEFIAIYDADNNPEPASLRTLVPYLIEDEKTAAVIGKFRTINKNAGWLTRFINIETIAFQWILQAGRYQMSKVSILPGTNYVIRKSVVQACGGWDERAITEDSELSMRIYQAGYTIRFMPLAVTWEQEPETLAVWVRQRMRWVRGNNYVMRKFFRRTLKSRFLFTEFIYLFALYYLFLLATVLSLMLFVLGGLGVIALNVPGPYFGVWVSAFILFVFEVLIALSYEEEDHARNILYVILMYFTYCQLWLFVVFKALIRDLRGYRVGVWDKTERFNIAVERSEEKIS